MRFGLAGKSTEIESAHAHFTKPQTCMMIRFGFPNPPTWSQRYSQNNARLIVWFNERYRLKGYCPGAYFLVIGLRGCAAGWGHIFTTGLTI